jgi:hypothetical protein
MELKVKVHEVRPTNKISATFQAREIIAVEDSNPKYPEYITFKLVQDKCSLADSLQVGQVINVHFNLKGKAKEYNGETKYFNSLEIWKIDNVANSPAKKSAPTEAYTPPMEVDDDLPF